ncbi:hypothetical protein M1328_03615 [Patescibacteria group bacterium]|nr:hypothetical protein [Patescibacteria group bacterium]
MPFPLLFLLVVFFFKNAFSMGFFGDDYFFLKISKVNYIADFFNFFSPAKSYFYRPIPTELFYYVVNLSKGNLFISHLMVFTVYFIGLYFSYLSIFKLTRNKPLAQLTIVLYAINFVHVFQLYQLSTFQEIAFYAFLSLSLYFFIETKYLLSTFFFVLGCMSKETAVLFPLFIIYLFFFSKKISSAKKYVFLFALISIVFAFIYKFGVNSVIAIDTYKIQFNPRLGLNNLLWYILWSLGFPNFLPDYFTSIFKKPIPEFWKVLANNQIKIYLIIVLIYLVILLVALILLVLKKRQLLKQFFVYFSVSAFSFILFISPTLLIFHKWMVRLTVPLIFTVFIEAYLILSLIKNKGIYRIVGWSLIIIYFFISWFGIAIHESSSSYMLERSIYKNASLYFKNHYQNISQSRYIYFQDPLTKNFDPWGGSQKLKVSFGDQNFLDYFFPGKNLKAIYEFENKKIPTNSAIIESFDDILKTSK